MIACPQWQRLLCHQPALLAIRHKSCDDSVLLDCSERRHHEPGDEFEAPTAAASPVNPLLGFEHIVNLDRIRGFDAVNLRLGYAMLKIRSPLEVWKDEDEDV